MEPEVSSPHSQAPATCPYPEPANSVVIPTSHFLKIHSNIILPSKPGSPQRSLSLRFPHQNPVHTSHMVIIPYLNPLKTKRKLRYLKTQSVPRCKHFSARL
jgi:hypothetical protein